MNLLKSLLILIALSCIPNFCVSQPKEPSSRKQRINQLVENDSIIEATSLLHADISRFKANNQPLSLAYTYQTLGSVFSHIESYNTASNYYVEAYHLFDSLNKPKEVDNILTQLSRNYVDGKDYSKFDSIIPIAIQHSTKLGSINVFYSLESKIRKNYFIRDYARTLEEADKALKYLEDFEFSSENKIEKVRLDASYKYYRGVALVNLKQFREGYQVLFKIDPNNFRTYGKENVFPLSQVSTLNYYKFRYFNERTKHLDSANTYLLIADSLKYLAIQDFQHRISKNGDLIYKIITTEKQLQLTNTKRRQQKVLSNAFLLSTIILSLLLTGLIIFFYYFYTNRKRINIINLKLKESNKKLKIIDKERLEFFSILSHELRTPIYGIGGLATLIKQEQSPEKRRSYLNALISSSNYISVLIDNVLQISKVKFENKQLHSKPTNVLQLVKRISSSLKVSANQKGLELYTNVEKTKWDELLLIDGVVLSQILINLSYNAIRYTSKGFVSINLTEQRRTNTHVNILFEIKDSGIGIQSKHRDIIFNAFENKTFLEKNSTGSGLGLYIVKTLLKSYNSEINFVSKPNEGSTFYFDIDFEIAQVASKTNQSSIIQLQSIPTKILVVDDNSINLMVTQKNVEKISGFGSDTASNGREAICLVKEKDYDLVLMDINMPDMDGYEATKHIRLFNPNIPILALTALNSAEIHTKALACGMNHVITKPYDFEEFKSILLSYSHVYQD
ncbi:phospho-acceptor domain-containing protein [Gelidibacter sediminis]|uniref:histidine kinase n=1 Tax=Gelidibacter sediminis TaxID=1608710 RepID=A0A4R7Q600_9FLAO|nr:response regulator [Gelidibacter sediminis]TDU42985.1 phospho-acceptor domain-containing protein [Gelidibacter sediminis]